MSRREGFSGQFRNPVTELVVMCRGKAYPLTIEGMVYGESGVAAVVVMGEVWGV